MYCCPLFFTFTPFAVNLYRCGRCCFYSLKQDTVEVGTYLRHAYPYAKLVIMGWHLSSKSKKNNPQVDVWIFSNDRIFIPLDKSFIKCWWLCFTKCRGGRSFHKHLVLHSLWSLNISEGVTFYKTLCWLITERVIMGNVFMQSRHFVYGVVICRDVAFHKKCPKMAGLCIL